MISTSNRTSVFISSVEELNSRLVKNTPLWLSNIQNAGASRFQQLGLPTVKDEEWKYTNIASIAEKKFHLPTEYNIIEIKDFEDYRTASDICIVFINGLFSKEYSNLKHLPKKCTLYTLSEINDEDRALIEPYLNKCNVGSEDAFAALNRAFLNQGVVVKVDDNAILNQLIHVIHITSGVKEDTIIFPRILVILGKSSEAEVLESHLSFCDASYFANAVTDIFLAENANFRYCKAQSESLKAFHIGATRVWQERDSQFESFSFSTGALMTRNNLTVTLNGEGASAILNGLYAVTGNQHVDNHTAVDHRIANCKSNQLYKGILDGNAKAVFNGKIFVKKEAQKTNSYQLNKNLLLGAGCQVNTKPQLEIFADDVRCTHGATIGQLNEDEIFYLQARSIPKALAIKMLSRGFVDDILGKIANKTIRERIDNLLISVFSLLK